jgi:2-aminoethylphosphonate-pyruvate transaminase
MVKKAVFMAAGVGSRLRGKLDSKPKGFIEIGANPIMVRSIEILLKQGVEKILIGTGFKSEHYERLADRYPQVSCVKNDRFRSTGSFFTLYNMRRSIEEDFLLLESDLLYEERAVSILQKDPAENVILASGWTGSGDEFYIETDEHRNLVDMSKKREELNDAYGELVGISKISHRFFRILCGWADTHLVEAQSRDYEYCLCQAAKTLPVAVRKVDDLIWVEIDDDSHLQRAVHHIYPRIKEIEHA